MRLFLSLEENDWITVKNLLIKYQQTDEKNPLIQEIIQTITWQTSLIERVYKFLKDNNLNPVFLPLRNDFESMKGGQTLIAYMGRYKSSNGEGINVFRKDYNNWINETHSIEKETA
tara:strand:- start:125 stop:472 length:348 start_codon:yes stop_codon:yes gene_type:complete